MDVVYDEGIRGRTVIDSMGRVLGQVEGLVVDVGSWQVRAVRVKLQKDVSDKLGEPRGTFRSAVIDVPAEAVTGVGDTVVLDRPVEHLAGGAAEAEGAPAPAH